MGEDVRRELFEIVGRDIITSMKERPRLERRKEEHERSRARALSDPRIVACIPGEVDERLLERRRHGHEMAGGCADIEELSAAHARLSGREFKRQVRIGIEHGELALSIDGLHAELKKEAIELRRRERIGAREIERVLRRDDEEEGIEWMRAIVDGDLFFGHRLKHRGLNLG